VLVDRARLNGTSSVLDIGCGAGRLAIGILEEIGSIVAYYGLDVRHDVIDWDRRFLTRRYPWLRFEHIDVANERYNSRGRQPAVTFTLPFGDRWFDVVFAYSLFSHMTGSDVASYLGEMHRVLHPAGTAVFTAFVEDGVPDEEANPPGYGPIGWEGALHCVRFRRDYFTEMVDNAGLRILALDHGQETDGQSLFVVEQSAVKVAPPPGAAGGSFAVDGRESTSEAAWAAPNGSFPVEVRESTSEPGEAAPDRSFPADLQEQAGENAGGWEYELDPSFRGTGLIPPERIVGAWRLDDDGSATDEFVANPSYRPSSPKTKGWGRRVAIAALLIVSAIVIGGLLGFAPGAHKNAGKTGPAASHPSSVAPSATRGTSTPAGSTAVGHRPRPHAPAASATPLHLVIVPTAPVWVCLVAQNGPVLINGQLLDPGAVSSSFVAPAFRIFLGNGSVRLRINGRVHSVPSSSEPPAYSVTQHGVVALPAGTTRPCA
jgi:SAM-dependent methyltransferase